MHASGLAKLTDELGFELGGVHSRPNVRPACEQGQAWEIVAEADIIGVMPSRVVEPLPKTAIPLPMEEIEAFCRKWGVKEFALFGSILREDFDDKSDVDVLITLRDETHRYFGDRLDWEDDLAAVFGRRVDVVTQDGIARGSNPLRREKILGSARTVYEGD